MKHENKEQTLESIITELQEAINCYDIVSNKTDIDRIILNLEKRVQLRKKAKTGLSTLAILFIITFGFSLLFNIMQLERTSALEVKISNLEYRDSLFNVIMEPDSNHSFSYYIQNGQPITYKQLSTENDFLLQRLNEAKAQREHYKSLQLHYATSLEAINSNLEYRDSLFHTFMELDSNNTFSYRIRNGQPITYKQLSCERDSLARKLKECLILNNSYRIQLDLVLKNYPIELKQNGDEYSVSAPKIDSALILLPYYRDVLKYDKHNQEWQIRILKRK